MFLRYLYLLLIAIGLTALIATTYPQSKAMAEVDKSGPSPMAKLAPARGYLDAHKNLQNPPGLLGGPLDIAISQKDGVVFVALPDQRNLDQYVFGTPDFPRTFGGAPGINGVPLKARNVQNGKYTTMKEKTPFGNAYVALNGVSLKLKARDATAVDAAKTDDSVQMEASWQDGAGNTYTVKCCKMVAPHGVEFPTFGGVVTNHILHGFTRLGTGLMPTEFAYFAFWGMGSVSKNGQVLEQPRLIHGMLTEYVRGQGYRLVNDNEVNPEKLQFHLMVPPMKPNMKEGYFEPDAVDTGFKLPNGMTLPFWHVMFEQIDYSATRE